MTGRSVAHTIAEWKSSRFRMTRNWDSNPATGWLPLMGQALCTMCVALLVRVPVPEGAL